MVTPEGEVMRGLEEFVGGGYKSEDAYMASKIYQQAQTSLYKLADKLNICGNNKNAQSIVELSESLKEIYKNVDFTDLDCRKE